VASEGALAKSLQMLAAAGIDMDDLKRRISARELSLDDIAKLVAETVVRNTD